MPDTLLTLRLPDGKTLEVARGTTLAEIAREIHPRLAKEAVAALVDGSVLDLGRAPSQGGALRFLKPGDPEALEVLRHSSAHLMAQAVKRLFPEAKFGVGPVIEEGFFYDMVLGRPLTQDDLAKIETEMHRIQQENLPIRRQELERAAALSWAADLGDEFKQELIGDIPRGDTISLYTQGEFTDLCTGPHVPATGWIKHFKLLSVAGAYWRGDEHRPMMQRIYGVSFFTAKELEEHLTWLEEVKKRDHRKLGKDLELFFFHPYAPAMPFFLPRGTVVYNLLVDFMRELYQEYGYQEVLTPQVFHSDLWRTSGHYQNYKDNMYFIDSDGDEYGLKPMNCPAHMLLFASRVRSYRELPLRIADFGRLHRFERSGVIRGLTRVRSFSQDDAHIFLAPEMIPDEIDRNFDMLGRVYRSLGLDFPRMALGTRPEKCSGAPELWEQAESMLIDCLKRRGEQYVVHAGDGAFYGPKIDFQVRDALGREHQLCTMQLDFNIPQAFDLHYSAADGSLQRPVVIHRAILGSLERFLGVYLEHTAGDLPFWLSPVQVRVLTVSQEVGDYGQEVGRRLRAADLRVEVDDRPEKIGAKIRDATLMKIPVLAVVGAREREGATVAVRLRGEGEQGSTGLDSFVEELVARRKEYR